MDNTLEDCDCQRLLSVLEDECLPDHDSPDIAVQHLWQLGPQTVAGWIFDALAGRESDRADAFYDPLTSPAEQIPPEVLDQTRQVPFQPAWPVRLDGRWLVFVLRQWAQEPPSDTLANQLLEHPAWLEEVERYRDVYERWRAHPDGQATDADDVWIHDPDRVWRTLGATAGGPPGRVLALRLRQAGLSDTPATMRHLRAVVAGQRSPLPRRGLCVTTQVLMQGRQAERDGQEGLELFNPTLRLDYDTNAADLTGPLLDRVNAVILSHKNWCLKYIVAAFGPNPLTDRRAKQRAAQQGSKSTRRGERMPHPVDYPVEALTGLLDAINPARRGGRNLDGVITSYIEAVGRRVQIRHRRAHRRAPDRVPPPPRAPEGWRDLVRDLAHAIAAKVAASGGTVPAEFVAQVEQAAADLASRAELRCNRACGIKPDTPDAVSSEETADAEHRRPPTAT